MVKDDVMTLGIRMYPAGKDGDVISFRSLFGVVVEMCRVGRRGGMKVYAKGMPVKALCFWP